MANAKPPYRKIPADVNDRVLPLAWEGIDMGSGALALDQVLSAVFGFVGKWSPDLQHNRAPYVLRYLLCRLYDAGRGNLSTAHLTLAQSTVARRLGLSRRWVGVLFARLQDAGWIDYHAPVLPDGMNGSCIVRIGRQLRRLLIMLAKSKRGKKLAKSEAQSRWHFSPSPEEKRLLHLLQKENEPPKPEVLARIPLLRTWLRRGEDRGGYGTRDRY